MHAFHELHIRVEALPLFHRNDAIFTHALEGLGHGLSNLQVIIGGDRRYVGNVIYLADINRLGQLRKLVNDNLGRLLHASVQGHGVRARSQISVGLAKERFSQHRRGGRAIAGNLGSLAGGFPHQLRA